MLSLQTLSITLLTTCAFTAFSPAVTLGPVTTLTELNSAIATADPGDTILMANGTWTDTVIIFNTDGLPEQPITLRAVTDGQVSMEGASRLRIAGDYLIVQGLHFTNGSVSDGAHVIEFRNGSSDLANNSRLTHCAITDYNPSDSSTNYKWVSVYGMNNRVDHCAFSGMNHAGVTLTIWLGTDAPPNNTRIDHNLFRDHAEGNGNGFETIRIGTSSRSLQDSKAIVEDNYFFRCDGEIEIISNKSVGNIYRRNTFESCSGQLTLRHGNECLVEGNYFLGNGVSGSSGVRVIGEDHIIINNYFENLRGTSSRAAIALMSGVPNSPLNRYFQVQRALIAYNTFSGCRENFAIGIEASDTELPPIDSIIANNIVQGADAPLIDYITPPENFTYEGNLFHGASLGISQPAGIQMIDPLLALAPDGIMRPSFSSPAIDAAVGNYPDILTDIDGDPRLSTSDDIGADEVSANAPLYAPRTSQTTGPLWLRTSQVAITGSTLTPEGAMITFTDLTGLSPFYTVERSETLKPDSWTVVSTIIPTDHNTTFTATDLNTSDNPVFWRIKYLQ